MNNYCVITTIHPPTKAVEILHNFFGWNLIVVGDKKTPEDWNYKTATYISTAYNDKYSPFNHYARKNLGYLMAMQKGATVIYDTDDDNIPNDWWQIRRLKTKITHTTKQKWCNVYQPVTSGRIWPRGFPLNMVNDEVELKEMDEEIECPIQQGLADISPDVDAIWRLTLNREVHFWVIKSMYLKNTWCPFNSQSTWFFKEAFPLMYLPITASFRMTDIWRSFVAQRILWEMGRGIAFHSPSEVYQERNYHDLMKDFVDEIDGYKFNLQITELFDKMSLRKGNEGILYNIWNLYHALVVNNYLKKEEMPAVEAWIKDYENVKRNLETTI